MTANSDPRNVSIPRTWQAVLSSANTNRDGTGTIVDLVDMTNATFGPNDGALVSRVLIKPTGNTTAGSVRFYLHDGTNWRLCHEIDIAAATPAAASQTTLYTWTPTDSSADVSFVVKFGYKLGASTHNAETFHVAVIGGTY